MGKARNPRRGSMQVWPRVRAKRMYPRVKGHAEEKEAKLVGFAGYKAGMTHIIINDAKKNSPTKGENVSVPVTVIECPPIKIIGARFYKQAYKSIQPLKDFLIKLDKEASRKINSPKKTSEIQDMEFDDLTLLAYTQPKMTGIGKKKPEIFELALGGTKEQKLDFAKANIGKELSVSDVFAEGQQIDARAVTTGKGFQGPVKRFGVRIHGRKKEKVKRGIGSLGDWKHKNTYRMAHAGQMGFHNRVDYNKVIMKIGTEPKDVNPDGGFIRYGDVKNTYLLLKGSIPGPKKRLIRLEKGIRTNKKFNDMLSPIQYISTKSKQ